MDNKGEIKEGFSDFGLRKHEYQEMFGGQDAGFYMSGNDDENDKYNSFTLWNYSLDFKNRQAAHIILIFKLRARKIIAGRRAQFKYW